MLAAYSLKNNRYSLRSKLPIVSKEAPKSWVQLAYEDEWKGHANGGFALDRTKFAQMIANFNAQENPIPVTYEHPNYVGDGKPIPAAGFILDLAVRGKELWGLVEWTASAVDLIREGAYRFCSMVFSEHSTSRQSGEDVGAELYELGLTNSPFLDGMEPIRLSRRFAMSIDKEKIKEAIDMLPDDASAEQLHQVVEGACLISDAMEGKAKEEKEPKDLGAVEVKKMPVDEYPCSTTALADAPAPAPEASPEGEASKMVLEKLMSIAGLDAAGAVAFLTDNADAIASIAGKQPENGMPADQTAMSVAVARAETLEARVIELSKRLDVYRSQEAELEARALEAQVDQAVKAGHILAHHRDTFLKLGRASKESLNEELARLSKSPVVPTGTIVRSAIAVGNAVEPRDEVERIIIERNKRDPELQLAALDAYRTRVAKKMNGRA